MKIIKGIMLAVIFILSQSALAEIVEQKPLPHQLGTFSHIRTSDTDFYVTVLNDGYQAQIYQQPALTQQTAKSLRTLSHEHDFLMAINGGFYTPHFKPAGLYIENGKIIHRAAKDPLLTACVGIDTQHKLILGTQRDKCSKAFAAIQAGPVLISQSHLNPGLDRLHPTLREFLAPHRRTIIAQSSEGKVMIITSSPTQLHNIAMLLQDNPAIFGINKIITAINLDGGTSTAMYIRFSPLPFYVPEYKKVKTFVFFS
jgi:exopolysaccharide biosynthesis protein